MKLSSNQRYLYRLIVGSVMVIWGLAELLLNPGRGSVIPVALIAAGMVFMVAGLKLRRLSRSLPFRESPDQDERTRRIGAWGISYSWFLTLLFMTALFWLDYARVLVLTTGTALAVSVIVMAVSARLFQWYFFRKGDVE